MAAHGLAGPIHSADVLMPALPPALKALAAPVDVTVQQTLQADVVCTGMGLHSGQQATVCLRPAPPGRGRYFVRTDLEGLPEIPAQVHAVQTAALSTRLGVGDATVRTVEHLLAALLGLGVDNARIEVHGPEIPLLDGSALDWSTAIATVGVCPQATPRPHPLVLTEAITVQEDDAFVVAVPAEQSQLTYGIDFPVTAIGQQWCSLPLQDFVTEIAPARTFGLAEQVDTLRARGLIKGGSLENALVCGPNGWLNPPLRYANEPVRHKLLDLIGDLSLLGQLPQAHVLAYKASHALHLQLAKHLSCLDVHHHTPVTSDCAP